ncbi:prolyl oligopeptidase family serine peptidase [Ginsengibacter hankyongi]|uniref:Prolyl oligopeptidase family serine peptidase n=1 Tax=Ginsengibacter hankyongi TaxID=2607284 RepID=A0A5J5IHF1_9BACT|nr:DPP IV N-terminal domain-containing protein [Ginsengibacter hankyongi]KAA9039386.1 prolyl oligopeptidase family serine peptidase [Ginsengibacter hankyongi]
MLTNFILKTSLSCFCITFLFFQSSAQKKDFTEEQLLKNKMPLVVVPLPTIDSWNDDSHLVLSRRAHPDSLAHQFVFDAKTRKEMAIEKRADVKMIHTGKSISIRNNDLYYTNGENAEIRLTKDSALEKNPTFSPDSNYVAYTKNNNLYVVNLNSRSEKQLTFDGNDSLMNGYASWVYTEEILGRASRYRAFWWSPDSRNIAFFRTDDRPVPVFTITNSAGQHGKVEKERYPAAGDKNPEVRIGIAHLGNSHITWADFNEHDDQYFGMPYWKPDGSSLLALWINRDQNDLKIYDVNLTTGSKKLFYEETQKTWIDLDDLNRITFLKNGNFVMLSDKTGWRHLYYYKSDGKLINPVTAGKFTVTEIKWIDEKNNTIFFTARGIENTARIDFYSTRLNGKGLKRLTFGEYNNRIEMSPSGAYFITTYSNAYTPAKMALLDNKGNKIADLGDSKGPEINNYNIAKTELIHVKSDDGLFNLPALITWPPNMDSTKKYPVLISIYGGPNAGTVWDNWTFNALQQWYAKEGLIQITMDHRASGQFGKEGVNYMYHNLGYWEMKDYSTIVKYLIDKGYADPKKICITGFSYGGYMTCYALTYGADVFTYGMAGGSVTDWSLYDSHYTEKFMGTPANNPAGYKSSSVLTWTNKYKGMLQIVHGEIDDNVHMQNSLQLISRLEDEKKDFEFMIYPGGRHGWPGNKWLQFQNSKTRFIYRYLLEKPVPADLLK